MKITKRVSAYVLMGLFAAVISANAQIYRFGLNGAGMTMFGDFAETEWNNSSAAYSEFGAAGNFYFTYYTQNNLGLSVRFNYTEYERDEDAYEKDLKTMLGITDNNYDMRTWEGSLSSSFQVGLSYRYNISESFEVEPYLYLGFMVFASPYEQVIWNNNSTTNTYQKYTSGALGFNYTPGVNLQWNVTKHFGINILMEYTGAALSDIDDESVRYNASSFTKNTVTKELSIQAFNFGLGINVSFGQGLDK
jgi:hypothetical protein